MQSCEERTKLEASQILIFNYFTKLENPMDREAWQATVYGCKRVRQNLVTKQQHFVLQDQICLLLQVSLDFLLLHSSSL